MINEKLLIALQRTKSRPPCSQSNGKVPVFVEFPPQPLQAPA